MPRPIRLGRPNRLVGVGLALLIASVCVSSVAAEMTMPPAQDYAVQVGDVVLRADFDATRTTDQGWELDRPDGTTYKIAYR